MDPCFLVTFLRTVKSLIRTYFLQVNITFIKLRDPKVGIDIFLLKKKYFFKFFHILKFKRLRAFGLQTPQAHFHP
jgi:hypothetical protein